MSHFQRCCRNQRFLLELEEIIYRLSDPLSIIHVLNEFFAFIHQTKIISVNIQVQFIGCFPDFGETFRCTNQFLSFICWLQVFFNFRRCTLLPNCQPIWIIFCFFNDNGNIRFYDDGITVWVQFRMGSTKSCKCLVQNHVWGDISISLSLQSVCKPFSFMYFYYLCLHGRKNLS